MCSLQESVMPFSIVLVMREVKTDLTLQLVIFLSHCGTSSVLLYL